MEFIAKGWSALKEVDRVIDYCELNDRRLIPLLRVISLNYTILLFSRDFVLFVSKIHAARSPLCWIYMEISI